jgi:diacylglycerol O-acyltransferase
VTNVPGPPVPIYSAGAKLVGLHGMLCLVDGVKLGHVIHSYCGEVTVNFTACRSAIPDPDFYSECIQKSFDTHLEAAVMLEDTAKAKTDASETKTVKTKTVKPSAKTSTKTVKTKTIAKTAANSNSG